MSGENLVSPQVEQIQLPQWTIDIIRGAGQMVIRMPLAWQSDGASRPRIVEVAEDVDLSEIYENTSINFKTQLSFILPEMA